MATVLLENLSIGYETGKSGERVVASGMTTSVNSGELTCLLGANGAGKSTLLRTIVAFQPPISGKVIIDGQVLSGMSGKDLSRKVSVVLTTKPNAGNLTVAELVGLGRSPYTGFWGNMSQEDKQIVAQSIRMVGIEELSDRKTHTLSDGERQKVMIAKALVQQTPIIILDEPTAFLDFQSRVEITRLLRQLAHGMGKTILLSTHDIALALRLSDRLWVMEDWQNLSVGTPVELAQRGVLSRYIERGGISFNPTTLEISVNVME